MQDQPSPYEQVITDAKGDYQLAVLPGPGTLAVSASLSGGGRTHYRKAEVEDFGLPVDQRGFLATTNHGLVLPENYEAAKAIDFSVDEKPVVNLKVTRLTDVVQVR